MNLDGLLDSARVEYVRRLTEAGFPPRPGDDTEYRALVTPLLRFTLPYLSSLVIARQSLGMVGVIATSLFGLMVAPDVSRFHFGYWHPVALWYALPMPYVIAALTTLAGVSALLHLLHGTERAKLVAVAQASADSVYGADDNSSLEARPQSPI